MLRLGKRKWPSQLSCRLWSNSWSASPWCKVATKILPQEWTMWSLERNRPLPNLSQWERLALLSSSHHWLSLNWTMSSSWRPWCSLAWRTNTGTLLTFSASWMSVAKARSANQISLKQWSAWESQLHAKMSKKFGTISMRSSRVGSDCLTWAMHITTRCSTLTSQSRLPSRTKQWRATKNSRNLSLTKS